MTIRSAAGIALSLITLGNVQAQVAPPASEAVTSAVADSNVFISTAVPLTPVGPTENAVGAFGGSQSMQQMLERLKDPAQRVLLRAEQRANLLESHAEVGRVLGIDAATESALIELLTDQQMEQLDLFHLRMTNPSFARESIYDQAARQTRRIEVRRELLGERGLEQYQAFEKTLGNRTQVRQLNARLDPAHKLTWEQTEQLVLLYGAHHARWRDENQAMASQPLEKMFETMPDPEEVQRRALLMTITRNEAMWRRLADYHRTLMDSAAAVLTAPQLAMLSTIQSERADQQQQRVEKLREQAGLSPQIPAASNTSSDAVPARTERDGDVRVSIRLSIDRKQPTIFSQVVRNGSPVTFDTGDGLFVDATPTLYEDGLFNLRLAYHEKASTGRRLLGETQQTGDLKQTAAVDLAHSGGSTGIIVGRKAYAVELNTRVEGM